LYKYGKGLDRKQEILVLTKIDLLNKDDYNEKVNLLKRYTKKSIHAISVKNKKTINKLVLNLLERSFEKEYIEEEKWTPLKNN
jgi:GTPase involved in cell partitioning and DNA repair